MVSCVLVVTHVYVTGFSKYSSINVLCTPEHLIDTHPQTIYQAKVSSRLQVTDGQRQVFILR